jgi:hypothetical protein
MSSTPVTQHRKYWKVETWHLWKVGMQTNPSVPPPSGTETRNLLLRWPKPIASSSSTSTYSWVSYLFTTSPNRDHSRCCTVEKIPFYDFHQRVGFLFSSPLATLAHNRALEKLESWTRSCKKIIWKKPQISPEQKRTLHSDRSTSPVQWDILYPHL